jgi:hypothetical protein
MAIAEVKATPPFGEVQQGALTSDWDMKMDGFLEAAL